MEAQCSVTTPPAKIPKLSHTGMAQSDEPMEIAAAGTSEIESLKSQICDIEKKVQKVDKQIQEVEKKVNESGSDRDILLRFMKKEEQLRTEKEQLRTKEEQLRTKEEQLRNLLLKERQPQLSPIPGLIDFFKEMPNAEKREYENPIAEQSDDSEDEESSQDEEGSSEDRTVIEDNAISTSVLQFPVPMPNTKLNQIYIRGCYDRIYDEYIQKCENTLIIGSPGIGKSYFSFYVAYRLLADYPTARILYGSGYTGYYIYKCGRDVRRLNPPPSNSLPHVDYYVFDCGQSKSAVLLDVLTAGSSKKSIVCSSPDVMNYKDYYKACIVAGAAGPVSMRIYMPTWTWDEVAFCRQHLYNIIPMPIVEKRFNVWGGIARQIFRSYVDVQDDDEEMLLGKIRTTDIQGVLSVVNTETPITTISSDILHAHPKEGNYASVVTKFASQFAAQHVYEKLERTSHASVISTMSAAASHPCLRGVYGLMFESYCHSQLPSERFQMKSLASAGGSETLELHRECRFFGKLQEIMSETKRNEYYFIPKVSNFPAVDAIAPPGMVFQMTVSHDHSVKRKYLLKIKKALQCSSLKLCFVVPEDIYAQFPQQKYLNEDNKVCEYKMDWVTQWAVCVPIKTNA